MKVTGCTKWLETCLETGELAIGDIDSQWIQNCFWGEVMAYYFLTNFKQTTYEDFLILGYTQWRN